MIATQETIRPALSVKAISIRRISNRLSLACPLLLSALLNMWNLAQNGFSNTYYSTAVRSMLENWHNFFFASYDAGGFITVDKPPVALWIQAISAKLFGFSSLSILLPEAIAGVGCVGIVYFLVKRLFGTLAAFLAATAMAITPIAVAVERGNNTDTFLLLFLLLAAWAITLAAEKGKLSLLLLSMALVGVAFNVKMLAAFIALPTFYLLYFMSAPLKWSKKILHLALATLVVIPVSFSWAIAVDLTPAAGRPYVGGSETNSVLDLALNYNGLGRVTGDEGNSIGGGGTRPQRFFQPGNTSGEGIAPPADATAPEGSAPPAGGAMSRTGSSGAFNAGVAGPTRLFGSELASQWSWLLPLAIVGGFATLFGLKRKFPLEPEAQSLILWGGWLATYGVVFSMAEGIFHTYYLIMLAPAVAALVGIGISSLVSAYRNGGWMAWLLPLSIFVTAAWQIKVLYDYGNAQWAGWLVPIVLVGGVVTSLPLLVTRLYSTRLWRRVSPALMTLSVITLLAAPFAWSATTTQAAGNSTLPTAGPTNTVVRGGVGRDTSMGGMPGSAANSTLLAYLEENSGASFYLVAVASANQASSIALETGKPVLAMGGFSGSDPATTVEKLQSMITTNEVNFVLLGGNGGNSATSTISTWVQANCTAIDSTATGTNSLYSCSNN